MKNAGRVVVLTSLLAAAVLPCAASAQAAPPASQLARDEAQDRFKRGVALYEEENFQAALVEFRRAYELVPAYQVLFNVARTCYQLRDYVCALRTYDRYLADGAAGIDAHRHEEVDREIASLRRRIVTVKLKAARGATIYVDGVANGDFPLSTPLLVNEGRRQLRATLPGREPVEKMVDLVGGETTVVDLAAAEPMAAATPAAGPKSETTLHYWLWGATGVLATVAGVTGGVALAASGDAKDMRSNGGTLSAYDTTETRMRTFGVVADVFAIAAIGTGVAALVVTLTREPKSSATTGSLRRSPGGGLANYGL